MDKFCNLYTESYLHSQIFPPTHYILLEQANSRKLKKAAMMEEIWRGDKNLFYSVKKEGKERKRRRRIGGEKRCRKK